MSQKEQGFEGSLCSYQGAGIPALSRTADAGPAERLHSLGDSLTTPPRAARRPFAGANMRRPPRVQVGPELILPGLPSVRNRTGVLSEPL